MASPYLTPGNHQLLASFLISPLWADVKSCLMERRPPAGLATDDLHVAAAKGHLRSGAELMILELEKLPTENDPASVPGAFDRPALDNRD